MGTGVNAKDGGGRMVAAGGQGVRVAAIVAVLEPAGRRRAIGMVRHEAIGR
jgi:hypothetical protein